MTEGVNGKSLPEIVEENAQDQLRPEKKQKFVQVHEHQEIHITGCAVSRIPMIHQFPELPEPEYQNYFVEPNKDYKRWLAEYEKNLALPEDERTVIEGAELHRVFEQARSGGESRPGKTVHTRIILSER